MKKNRKKARLNRKLKRHQLRQHPKTPANVITKAQPEITHKKRKTPNQRRYEELVNEIRDFQKENPSIDLPDYLTDLLQEIPKRLTQDFLNALQEAIVNLNEQKDDIMKEWDFANNLISNITAEFNGYPDKIASTMIEWINNLVNQYGAIAVADMFSRCPDNFKDYIQRRGYDSKQNLQDYMSAVIQYLDLGTLERQNLQDAIDELGWEEV